MANLHTCRSTVHSWSGESGLCVHHQRGADTVNVSLTDRQESDCTVAVIFVNRIASLTSYFTNNGNNHFSSGRYRNRRCCQCRCVLRRRREERNGRHASIAWQSTWTLLTMGVFFVPRFFRCLHQQRQRPVFHHIALTIARFVLLRTQA